MRHSSQQKRHESWNLHCQLSPGPFSNRLYPPSTPHPQVLWSTPKVSLLKKQNLGWPFPQEVTHGHIQIFWPAPTFGPWVQTPRLANLANRRWPLRCQAQLTSRKMIFSTHRKHTCSSPWCLKSTQNPIGFQVSKFSKWFCQVPRFKTGKRFSASKGICRGALCTLLSTHLSHETFSHRRCGDPLVPFRLHCVPSLHSWGLAHSSFLRFRDCRLAPSKPPYPSDPSLQLWAFQLLGHWSRLSTRLGCSCLLACHSSWPFQLWNSFLRFRDCRLAPSKPPYPLDPSLQRPLGFPAVWPLVASCAFRCACLCSWFRTFPKLPPAPPKTLAAACSGLSSSFHGFLTDSLRSRRKGRLRNVPLQMNTRNSPALAIFYFNMPPSLGSTLCKSNSNSSIQLKKGVGGTRALAHSIFSKWFC